MERNTKTTVYELKPGDRFYKWNDKKKEVYEKMSHSIRGVSWCLLAAYADNENLPTFRKEHCTFMMKHDTEVIFLRHKDAD